MFEFRFAGSGRAAALTFRSVIDTLTQRPKLSVTAA